MKISTSFFFLLIMVFICRDRPLQAQNSIDTVNLPKISIQSLNGFGPYVIGTKRTNYFIVDSLPPNTSKVMLRMIDSNGETINHGHTDTGENLQMSYWQFESDTMGFPISPQLNVEVQYQQDSIANYYIPYTVYPDTIRFRASVGWGPFITNNYQRSDTSWHDVPENKNTFSLANLPPRTDAVKFTIYTADSVGIDSLIVTAKAGSYLDSVAWPDVRMDMLPLTTRFIEAAAFCQGGPEIGMISGKQLTIVPQSPRMKSMIEGIEYNDSIPAIEQFQWYGQALMIDTNKYAEVFNGPGYPWYRPWGVQYIGPYSFDIVQGSYTIEGWFKFEQDVVAGTQAEQFVMAVDSLWSISFASNNYTGAVYMYFWSGAGGSDDLLAEAILPIGTSREWHHIAYTFTYENGKNDFDVKFYLDGNRLGSSDVTIYANTFIDISNSSYRDFRKTNHLRFGQNGLAGLSTAQIVSALDEIRIWDCAMPADSIKKNYNRTVLQDQGLLGYWNFDDSRNRLKTLTDLSFKNNTGLLQNGAYFIAQDPEIIFQSDTLRVCSSNSLTDSIAYAFIRADNTLFTRMVKPATNATASLQYDLSDLSWYVDKLVVSEYYPGCPDSGYQTEYPVFVAPPKPMATPKYNWSTFYQSDGEGDEIINVIKLTNLPDGVAKIEAGLEKDGEYYDVQTFTQNSIPYRNSLTLNGTDNYIQTSDKVSVPTQGEVSFWFNTSTAKGAKLAGFGTTQDGANSTRNEREILLEKDGSLRFRVDPTHTLYALHAYNDGEWHYVSASFGALSASLSVDGAEVDRQSIGYLESYEGYWTIGRNHAKSKFGYRNLDEFYKGSLAEFKVWSASGSSMYLKMDDGTGSVIRDNDGSNDGSIQGETQNWLSTPDNISVVKWSGNMVRLAPGGYTFYTRLFYNGGPAGGVHYPLGNFNIENPFEDCHFAYYLSKGLGFFNEGTLLNNNITILTDLSSGGDANYIRCTFVSPDHDVIRDELQVYDAMQELDFSFDMGDAPAGSYMVFSAGNISGNDTLLSDYFMVPMYIHSIIPPTVSGDFGPFLQAIAPGTMEQENTFTIQTEHFDDLNKITGKFYSEAGEEVGSANAQKINDTVWHLTYGMGCLPPPAVHLNIEYYLGENPHPALIEGPYAITIQKTRPGWFDFLDDTAYHNVSETANEVDFSLTTYLGKDKDVQNTLEFTIPKGVPFMGGTSFSNGKPTVRAYLKFIKSQNKLELAEKPHFHQETLQLKFGPPEIVDLELDESEDNTYYLDDQNNLIATQNFSAYGELTWSIKRMVENPAERILWLYKVLKIYKWTKAGLVQATANFTVSPGIGYASRLNYKVDTTNGKWGSFGNLNIDPNPAHPEAYKNSASYNYLVSGINGELSLGITFGSGLVDVYAALALGLYAGGGRSYVEIPHNKHSWRLSSEIVISYRVYLTALWSWYEVNLYGPKVLWHGKVGDDDLSEFVPPFDGKQIKNFNAAGDLGIGKSLNTIPPVGWYYKMPLPQPQHSINLNNDHSLVVWLEPGKIYGERELLVRRLDHKLKKFDDLKMMSSNHHAIQKPGAKLIDDQTLVSVWMQTRHTPQSIQGVKSEDIIQTVVQSQDIWYSVYDIENDTPLLYGPVEDDMRSTMSGRAEGNPTITVLSEDKVLITWQVADLEKEKSDIWYTILERVDGQWDEASPKVLAEPGGTQTQLKVACFEENKAVLVWKNFNDNDNISNRLMSAVYSNGEWSEPMAVFPEDTTIHYNYIDFDFKENMGAMVYSTWSKDPEVENHEVLSLVRWNFRAEWWDVGYTEILFANDDDNIQVPRIAIHSNGKTAVVFKLGQGGTPQAKRRVSQVDLITGDFYSTPSSWNHFAANNLVCDTTKQVSDLDIGFIGTDTIMILSHEFIMAATNVPYAPLNGITFGDARMNLVLRTIWIPDSGEIIDLKENLFFDVSPEPIDYADVVLDQNYPNPCSDRTMATFYLPQLNRNVLMQIFDINGSLAGTVINTGLDPGMYEAEINTSQLKSGTYIIRLTTDHAVRSRKMIVKN